MAAPTRKRSRDEATRHDQADESSQTAVGDIDQATSQVKPADSQADSPATVLPSVSAHTMPPPTPSMLPPSSMPPPYSTAPPPQKPPQSAQRSHQAQPQQDAPVKSIEQHNSDETIPDDDDADGSNVSITPSEPQDKIVDFDWIDLQERYHHRMTELDQNEQEILQEFNQLCDFFGVWASTSQGHEVERSFKRLKTQMTYVQHEEDVLEQKRGHYIRVVDAFKSALQLLGN